MKPNVTITLTHEEAMRLKAMVQNPLHDNETNEEAQIRALIWSALPAEPNRCRPACIVIDDPY